jgi:aspartyl-tRNA(Asn)/glutamyl-tRNA(Gln) amidotransferase subunit B
VSVRPMGSDTLGTRCEIKNLNSFRFLEQAINHEVARQIDVIEGGGRIVQETRLYDPDRDETRSMRSKEDAHDYRYFPDPDLLPLAVSEEWIERTRAALPELPEARRTRYESALGLSGYDAATLTQSRELADYFDDVASRLGDPAAAKLASNWVTGDLAGALNRADLEVARSPVASAALAGLLARIRDNTISGKIAKDVFEMMWTEGALDAGAADTIIEKKGLKQITDSSAIEALIDAVLAANPKSVEEFRAGKEKAFNALVGQAMKASKGQGSPALINELLKKKLGSL